METDADVCKMSNVTKRYRDELGYWPDPITTETTREYRPTDLAAIEKLEKKYGKLADLEAWDRALSVRSNRGGDMAILSEEELATTDLTGSRIFVEHCYPEGVKFPRGNQIKPEIYDLPTKRSVPIGHVAISDNTVARGDLWVKLHIDPSGMSDEEIEDLRRKLRGLPMAHTSPTYVVTKAKGEVAKRAAERINSEQGGRCAVTQLADGRYVVWIELTLCRFPDTDSDIVRVKATREIEPTKRTTDMAEQQQQQQQQPQQQQAAPAQAQTTAGTPQEQKAPQPQQQQQQQKAPDPVPQKSQVPTQVTAQAQQPTPAQSAPQIQQQQQQQQRTATSMDVDSEHKPAQMATPDGPRQQAQQASAFTPEQLKQMMDDLRSVKEENKRLSGIVDRGESEKLLSKYAETFGMDVDKARVATEGLPSDTIRGQIERLAKFQPAARAATAAASSAPAAAQDVQMAEPSNKARKPDAQAAAGTTPAPTAQGQQQQQQRGSKPVQAPPHDTIRDKWEQTAPASHAGDQSHPRPIVSREGIGMSNAELIARLEETAPRFGGSYFADDSFRQLLNVPGDDSPM